MLKYSVLLIVSLTFIVFLTFLTFLTFTACSKNNQVITGQIPDITLTSTTGQQVSLRQSLGSITLLVFWATWCQPCIMEIPSLNKLQAEFQNSGLKIISINVDDPQGYKISEIRKRYPIQYPVLLGDEAVMAKFGGISSLPTSFFVSKDGKLLEKVEGLLPEYLLESKVKQYLAMQ